MITLTKRNIIILHPTDVGPCSYYRMRWPADLITSRYGDDVSVIVSPFEITDEYVLSHTAAVVILRPYNEENETLISRYLRKRGRLGFRIFADYDDLLFDVKGKSAMNSYNKFPIDTKKSRETIASFISKIDGVTCSTRFLSACVRAEFGINNVSVLPNAVPRNLFGHDVRKSIGKDIRKPRVLFGGALACHFKEGNDGDFSGPWIPWLKEAVGKDEIELHCFGDSENVPHVFLDFIDRVHVHPCVSTAEWPSTLASIHPDFYIAPLAENIFNASKSNLKMLEATAIGAVVVPSVWKYSPYMEAHYSTAVTPDMTPEALREKIASLSRKDAFNEALAHQFEAMDILGYWMDSEEYLLKWLKAYFGSALRTNR